MTLTSFLLQPYQITIQMTLTGCEAEIKSLGIKAEGRNPTEAITALKQKKREYYANCADVSKIPEAGRCNPVSQRR